MNPLFLPRLPITDDSVTSQLCAGEIDALMFFPGPLICRPRRAGPAFRRIKPARLRPNGRHKTVPSTATSWLEPGARKTKFMILVPSNRGVTPTVRISLSEFHDSKIPFDINRLKSYIQGTGVIAYSVRNYLAGRYACNCMPALKVKEFQLRSLSA